MFSTSRFVALLAPMRWMRYKKLDSETRGVVDMEEVRRVADNARLDIDDEEAEQFQQDFEDILEMFDALEEIDTSDVEPAFHPVDVEPETREDEAEETLSREEVFRNTDNEEDGRFKGPGA